jgi:phage terminase large subunit-like protein
LKKDIIPVGDPSTNIVAAGTPIHAEAIVCALRAANWPARSYCALISESTRMDLWEECGRLMTDLSDPAAGATAKAFYEANRAAMDEGAQLLWPERHGLYFYMEYRTLYGEPAYRSEYTDDPGTPEGAEWPAELFEWPGFWFHEWPTTLIAKIIALDPSKGNDAKSGDRQAHAMVGLGVDGNLYIDVDARHETPEAMCERTCYLYRDFNKTGRQVDSVVLEDNGTLGLIQVAARLAMEKTQTAGMPWSCLTQRDPKPLRIRCVSSYLYTKRIRLRNTPGSRIALKEWKEFPYSDRDDCVDAIATAIRDLEHRLSQR